VIRDTNLLEHMHCVVCIAYISIDWQPNDLNECVYFRHERVYAHHAHIVLQFGRDHPNKGIRAPTMANISASGILWHRGVAD